MVIQIDTEKRWSNVYFFKYIGTKVIGNYSFLPYIK